MVRRVVVPDLGEPDVRSCPQCGARFRRTLVRFAPRRQFFGYFPADVCRNGHEWLTPESGAAIEAAYKARGAWGRKTRP